MHFWNERQGAKQNRLAPFQTLHSQRKHFVDRGRDRGRTLRSSTKKCVYFSLAVFPQKGVRISRRNALRRSPPPSLCLRRSISCLVESARGEFLRRFSRIPDTKWLRQEIHEKLNLKKLCWRENISWRTYNFARRGSFFLPWHL